MDYELFVSGAIQVLALFPATAPVAGISSIAFQAWQKEQLDRFYRRVESRVKNLDQKKIDRSALESDQFRELVIQAVRAASDTSSEIKRRALADALVNSILLPTSRFSGMQMLMRVLAQLSDEEIQLMTALSALESVERPENPDKAQGVTLPELTLALQWNEEDVLISVEGLRTLGLVYDPNVGTWNEFQHAYWGLSPLSRKLVAWCQSP